MLKLIFHKKATCRNDEAPVQEKPALGLRNRLTISGQCRKCRKIEMVTSAREVAVRQIYGLKS